MRIAFITCQSGSKTSGAINSLSRLMDALLLHGGAEHTIITNDSHRVEEWRSRGHEVEIVPLDKKPSSLLLLNDEIREILIRRKIELVHFNELTELLNGFEATKILGLPSVLTMRCSSTFNRKGVELIRSLCNATIVLSNEMQTTVEERLPGTTPVHVIPSIVAPPTFMDKAVARRILGLPQQGKLIAIIGRLVKQKRTLEAMQALSRRDRSRFELYCLGDLGGPRDVNLKYHSSCLAALSASPSEHLVHFMGHQADMVPWYNALDLVIVPSANEGLSRATIESLSYGIPVVSTPVMSARETLEPTGCGRVTSFEYDSLFEEATNLLNSPETMIEMGLRGKELAKERFSAGSSLKRHLELYRSLT